MDPRPTGPPPAQPTIEELDLLAASGRLSLDEYWRARGELERRLELDAHDRRYDPPDPAAERDAGGVGFVAPPPRPGSPRTQERPPPPLVPPPPPPAQGPPVWVTLPIPGPSIDAASTRADDTPRRGRRRRRRT